MQQEQQKAAKQNSHINLALFYEKLRETGRDVVSIAAEADISKTAMYCKLKGESSVRLEEVPRLANAMHLTVEEAYNIFVDAYLREIV